MKKKKKIKPVTSDPIESNEADEDREKTLPLKKRTLPYAVIMVRKYKESGEIEEENSMSINLHINNNKMETKTE